MDKWMSGLMDKKFIRENRCFGGPRDLKPLNYFYVNLINPRAKNIHSSIYSFIH
jgi:hypothetical protein